MILQENFRKLKIRLRIKYENKLDSQPFYRDAFRVQNDTKQLCTVDNSVTEKLIKNAKTLIGVSIGQTPSGVYEEKHKNEENEEIG